MKKVIKPSPLLVILFGIATAICLILTVIEFIKKHGVSVSIDA